MPARSASRNVILYRESPLGTLDRLVRERCPAGFELRTANATTPREVTAGLLAEADFLLGSWALTDKEFGVARRLKLIQLTSAGYDWLDLDLAARHGVPIANNGGGNAIGVAEHTILLILALAKRLLQHDAGVRGGRWQADSTPMFELWHKRVGIVGLGKIGTHVARLARAFEAEVLYHDIRRLDVSTEQRLGVTFLPLKGLLSSADIVTLHVPLTRATRHLIGAPELQRMKQGAILINTSRGPVVDEAALCETLRAGHLAGAGLDVFEQEPPRPQHPLFSLDNVVLSPHLAAGTSDSWSRIVDNCYANIVRVARGEAPWHLAEDFDHGSSTTSVE